MPFSAAADYRHPNRRHCGTCGDKMNRRIHAVTASAGATLPAYSTGWCPGLINLGVNARDKHDLFGIAAEMLQRECCVDPAPILRALWRREEAGSTGLGQGIAIPHARVSGISEPLTMLLRMRAPIPFDAPDGKPVSLVLVIIVPTNDATERHLEMLAGIASLCSEPAFRRRLAEASNASDVRRAFAVGGGARSEALAQNRAA
jgi:PTS system nitrogen regulatory IIA component